MEGKRQSFVLEKQIGMRGDGLGDARAGEVQLFRREMVSGNLSGTTAPLEAVLARDGQAHIAKDGIDVADRPPADQRKCPARRLVQLSDEGLELALENNLSR